MSHESQGPTFVPYFGYRDAAVALQWLASAFGFEKTQEFLGPDETVMHAEMSFAGGMIMIGTSPDKQRGETPPEHGIYVCVDDVDAHYERAKKAGAQIVYGPEDTEFGTRRYRVQDPEGYEWSFGTYRPSSGR